MYDITIFGLNLTIDPIAFTIPIGKGWDVYWYAIIISIGFILATVYALKRASQFGIDSNKLIDAILVTLPAGIIGARLYYIAFDESLTIKDFFGTHNGGLAIYGGIIGGALALIIMCKIKKLDVLSVLDVSAIGVILAQSIGRWGNFFNQEAFGTLTGSDFWGMSSQNTEAVVGPGLVHPTFLYESVWCFIGFVLLHFYSKRRKFKGEIVLMYTIWYGFGRFFIEGLRTDSLYIGEIRVSQLIAAASVICGVILYFILKNKSAKAALNSAEYSDVIIDDIEEEIVSIKDNLQETTIQDEIVLQKQSDEINLDDTKPASCEEITDENNFIEQTDEKIITDKNSSQSDEQQEV